MTNWFNMNESVFVSFHLLPYEQNVIADKEASFRLLNILGNYRANFLVSRALTMQFATLKKAFVQLSMNNGSV